MPTRVLEEETVSKFDCEVTVINPLPEALWKKAARIDRKKKVRNKRRSSEKKKLATMNDDTP